MNNIRRVLSDGFGCLVDVPGNLMSVTGNFMDVLGIFVCALLKGSLGRYEQHRTVRFRPQT